MSTPEFTVSDAKRFDIKAQRAIALAIYLGWTCRWANSTKRMAVLSYGQKRIQIPSTNINAGRSASWTKQIIREADPQAVLALVTKGEGDMTKLTPEQQAAVALVGTYLVDAAREHLGMTKGDKMPGLTQPVGDSAPKPTPPPAKAAEPKPEPPKQDVSMVHLEVKRRYPYTASRGGSASSGYPSDIIEVIEFANGFTTFGCKRCEYMNSNPQSVRAHSVQAHRGEGSPQHKVETKPEPPKSEVSKVVGVPLLTAVITEARKGTVSSRDIAVHIVNQPWDTRCHLAMLLLNGIQFEQLRTTAEDAVAEAKAEADSLRREALQAIEDRNKMESDLASLKELIAGLGHR